MITRRTLAISVAVLLSCVLGRAAVVNTEILGYVHPLIYSSISTVSVSTTISFSEFSSIEASYEESESQRIPCASTSYDGSDLTGECAINSNQSINWLVWFCLTVGAMAASFLEWYSQSLETNPVLTKSITAGFMGALGDILAQAVEAWTEKTNRGTFRWRDLQVRRMLSVAAEGLCISGPLMHFAYDFLEEHLPIFSEDGEEQASALHSWAMVFCQVFVDTIFMDSVFVATLIITSALLEGRAKEITREMTTSYIPAVKVSWLSSLFWSPVQVLSFKYIPCSYRVAAINLQDIAWNASISFMAHQSRHAHHNDLKLDEDEPNRSTKAASS